jgi:hypothetical protein
VNKKTSKKFKTCCWADVPVYKVPFFVDLNCFEYSKDYNPESTGCYVYDDGNCACEMPDCDVCGKSYLDKHEALKPTRSVLKKAKINNTIFLEKLELRKQEERERLEKKKADGLHPRKPFSRKLLLQLFSRDKFFCTYCGRSPTTDSEVVLVPDHRIPLSRKGDNSITNLVTSCSECNTSKGKKTEEEFRKLLKEKTEQAVVQMEVPKESQSPSLEGPGLCAESPKES